MKLKPFLFPAHLFTMENMDVERLHFGESDSSMRFRDKMHKYDAHHQVLLEAAYAREAVRHAVWLRQRNEQRDLKRATGPQQKHDH